jgi:geranylgeranyl diphosphate synthase, type I
VRCRAGGAWPELSGGGRWPTLDAVTAAPLDAEDLGARVQKILDAFVADQGARLNAVSADLGPFVDVLAGLLAGGKRLRPAFCYWGWRGSGAGDAEPIVRAAASLELLHACALIHDDVMDGSDTRRGRPAAHRRFAELHRGGGWQGSGESFGTGAAILLGDLCLVWADKLLYASGLADGALRTAKPVFDEMRTELMAGQYLDLLEQATGTGSVDRAMRVLRYKSAKYTVERPLHLGAALAGAAPSLHEAYTAYGLPLGEAFQLRDDVLGVFGDPAETGKPAGDDLREGKRTVLVAFALAQAPAADADLLRGRLGDPGLDAAGVDDLRAVIGSSGALDRVEDLIARYTAEALDALSRGEVAEPAAAVLSALAHAATARSV